MARVWFHIGHGKTGTSAIQAALRHRAQARGDLFHPLRGQMPTGAHHLLFPLGKADWDERVIATLAGLATDLDRVAGSLPVVLSSEHLCYVAPGNVARLAGIFADHDARVVYYIRRQDDLIESSFRQKHIEKPGQDHDPVAFVEMSGKAFDFERRIAPWEARFGAGRLRLRLYHPRTCAADVVADFEQVIGLAPLVGGSAANGAARANLSLGPAMVRVLQLFDRHYPDAPGRAAFVEGLRSLSETAAAGAPRLIAPDLRRAVMARHAASNARIAARYLEPDEAAHLLAP